MLQMFGEESVKTPLARSIMTALASMTVHPGARNLLQASAPKVLEMATRGGRAIREKTCLALMNLVTNKECRDVLIEKGVIRVLLDLLQEGSGEEEDPGAGFLEYVVGALCNISNAGFHEKVWLLISNVTPPSLYRCPRDPSVQLVKLRLEMA